MKTPIAALVAVLCAASAQPAAACYLCSWEAAVSDDMYPPGEPPLPPSVQALVRARLDAGLSQAGFYNDPQLALAAPRYLAPTPAYGFAPPPVAYVDAPQVIVDPYGRRRRVHARAY